MINRSLIRLKTLQIFYAHTQDADRKLSQSIKQLNQSLDLSYELYRHLLALLTDVREYAERRAMFRKARAQRLSTTDHTLAADSLLAQNKLLLKLGENEELAAFKAHRRELWKVGDTFLTRLVDLCTQSDLFIEYAEKGDVSFSADCRVAIGFYRNFFCDNDDLAQAFEEANVFWNDDRCVIDSFVLKTLRSFRQDTPSDAPLMPQYAEGESSSFGEELLTAAIKRREELDGIIDRHLQGWDENRVALMDRLIMQLALAEALTVADVPLKVTFSEYIGLARHYSTPKSAAYVNGVLNAAMETLKAEGKLYK